MNTQTKVMEKNSADKWAVLLLALIGSLLLGVYVAGCKSTGVSLVVGEQTLLPEISDAGDNVSVKFYEDVKGARVWARENSKVKARYKCAVTNDYLGVWHTRSYMDLDVKVEPCETEKDVSEQ